MRSKRRVWLFRVAAALLAPVLALGVLELALRLAGYGYPTRFFIEGGESPGPEPARLLKENDQFGWRFFPRALARGPLPRVLRAEKPPGTTRIFVLGGSAAKGEPAPEFGFARVLEVLLRARHPERDFEVVNVGVTAINSHVVRSIASEIAALGGDFWVVYMGNNEVIGPFGPGTAFGARDPGSPLLRFRAAVSATRVGQLLVSLARGEDDGESSPETWRGMEMFVDRQVRRDDPRMEIVYRHLAGNLDEIIEAGRQGGARVLVGTVATNLGDCGPFASLNSAGLSPGDGEEWRRLYDEGSAFQSRGATTEALEAFGKALSIDPDHAELHFRVATCYETLERHREAREHYVLARDLDTLRFRADSRVSRVIRDAARGREQEGVYLVDAEGRIAEESPRGIPGREHFYEHVHFSFEGNYVIGRLFAEKISDLLPGGSPLTEPWLDLARCARRLALTPWDQLRVTRIVRRRLNKPPYSGQPGHAERDRSLAKHSEDLESLVGAAGFEGQDGVYREAIAGTPNDWVLREQYGSFLAAYGKHAAAADEFRRTLELVPHHYSARYRLGVVHFYRDAIGDAESCFREVLRLKPRFFEALSGLGLALARQGRHEAACEQFARALEIRPDDPIAHVQLGSSLEALAKNEEAASHYREALRIDPSNERARRAVAKLSGKLDPPADPLPEEPALPASAGDGEGE